LVKIIVCITGMPGAGKSTIVNKLEELGFEKFSLGDGIRAEAKRRSIEPSGENLGKIMLEVREKNGPGAVAELIKEPIQNSIEEVIIIDGVRSIAEIDVLKKIGDVKLLAIQASSETRFNFLSSRGRSDDPKTRENFEERDNREIGVGIDKSIENADKIITNHNLTIDELVNSAKEIIENWIK
jgi:dephospho-CoA kinase